MIKLFKHNEEAYKASVRMLAEKGKAAIIHPTGTGKSFIGFKLCEDNPDKTICWLSPSEYIFKTQLENLASVSNGWQPENIKYFTFARLMTMTDEEMKEINADFLIVDEYHRLGADFWGMYFNKLRSYYPKVPMLGLSATNIRYLDNQRDMAKELFDGNIASEMSLGEAIVRGILNPPKYVLSIYSYQKDLERFEDRIKRAKNKASKEEAEKYLEALRRTLEKADGIDDIFAKNMDDKTGKYIVFCADYEHMQDIIACNIKEWLCKVSTDFKIYTFYSGDSESDKSFKEFKEDNDNTKLRLLFCIDALNEGVHVEDISGVILLRPTVSPIIYKQQIGRALSASKTKSPVIFDIVNNIENLYSIDGVKEEMQEAVRYFERNGDNSMIVNERFEIIDKVAECRELFRKLEGSLSEGWELMFEKAKAYYKKNGNLEVSKKSEEYPGLNSWLTIQRQVYNGKIRGNLTQAQIGKLDSIGMRWISKDEANWERYYAACVKYKEKHGNLLVPASYIDGDIHLGSFISSMRNHRKNNQYTGTIASEEHIKALEKIGMVWDMSEYQFQKYYQCAVKYYEKHGAVNCSETYVDNETGLRLGSWCSNIRNKVQNISTEQIEMLNEINFSWSNTFTEKWQKSFEEVKKYYEEKGNANIPVNYSSNDINIGRWMRAQREKYISGKLSENQINLLNSVGMIWNDIDAWKKKYLLLEKYYREHGDLKIPSDYIVDGVWLNKWLNTQINAGEGKIKKVLTDEQKSKLKSLGISFDGKRHIDNLWEERIKQCRKFYEENGHLNVTKEYDEVLFRWLNSQKRFYRQGKLSPEIKEELDKFKINWNTKVENAFLNGIEHASEYFSENGNLEVSSSFICSDSYALGNFIANQRNKYKKGKLTQSKINELEKIGMIWDYKEYLWNSSFEKAYNYFKIHGFVPQKYNKNHTKEEYEIYEWIRGQRKNISSTTVEKYEKLKSIGIIPIKKTGSDNSVSGGPRIINDI